MLWINYFKQALNWIYNLITYLSLSKCLKHMRLYNTQALHRRGTQQKVIDPHLI